MKLLFYAAFVSMVGVIAVYCTFAGRSSIAMPQQIGGLALPPIVTQAPDPVDVVVPRLKREEGISRTPYYDSLGFLTICYGARLPLTVAELDHIGADRDLSLGLTETECDWLLRGRVRTNANDFIGRWPPYADQPFGVQVALVDLAYELGPAGLARFDAMLGFLEARDYEAAARDVLGTLLDRQAPARAEAAAAACRSGRRS